MDHAQLGLNTAALRRLDALHMSHSDATSLETVSLIRLSV
jgi:hypothetical protein